MIGAEAFRAQRHPLGSCCSWFHLVGKVYSLPGGEITRKSRAPEHVGVKGETNESEWTRFSIISIRIISGRMAAGSHSSARKPRWSVPSSTRRIESECSLATGAICDSLAAGMAAVGEFAARQLTRAAEHRERHRRQQQGLSPVTTVRVAIRAWPIPSRTVPAQLTGRMPRKSHGHCWLSCTIQGVPLALQVEARTSCVYAFGGLWPRRAAAA